MEKNSITLTATKELLQKKKTNKKKPTTKIIKMTMGRKKSHLIFIAMNVKKGTLYRIETIEFLMEKKGDKKITSV